MEDALSQVVLLPGQLDRLASLSNETKGAIGIFQSGSTLLINTGGASKFWMDANGDNIDPPNQESFPC